jgi:Zn-dependent peptidase ImmA (M78 family)
MKIREILTESLSHNQAEKLLKEFLSFLKTDLELDELPTIHLIKNSDYSVKNSSFGGYRPADKSINVMISNRHIQDVMRTLTHELIHYIQDLKGELTNDSGKDGSPQENEANSRAAVSMRRWGKLHPEFFGFESIE